MNIERIIGIGLLTIGLVMMMFASLGWDGEYVKRDIYDYDTERQCLIDEEWTKVDLYLIQWGTDWYKIDGRKTFVQGKELQCSKEYISTYIETKEVYEPGIKDFVMFWEWGE